jgi:hypothetical protein
MMNKTVLLEIISNSELYKTSTLTEDKKENLAINLVNNILEKGVWLNPFSWEDIQNTEALNPRFHNPRNIRI